MAKPKAGTVQFEVVGAGQISISDNDRAICGNSVGFLFETDWDKNFRHFAGGVLSRGDALKLADHIYTTMGYEVPKRSSTINNIKEGYFL